MTTLLVTVFVRVVRTMSEPEIEVFGVLQSHRGPTAGGGMADDRAGPKETPRGEKRAVRDYETPITGPASKAQCTEAASSSGGGGGGGGVSALLAQLKTTVAALKAAGLRTFDAAQLKAVSSAGLELLCDSNDEEKRREDERRRPVGEETPLPFDLLVHTLIYLPAKDIAAAAQVSRHFNRAVPAVVEHRLSHLKGFFSRFPLQGNDTYCAEVLQRGEDAFALATKLIKTITPTMSGKEFDKVVAELDAMDNHTIHMVHEDLWPKADELQGNRRGNLLQVLQLARLPQDELVKHLDSILSSLYDHENKGSALSALYLMQQMPPFAIEPHLPELMWWATSHEQKRMGLASAALCTLACLPAETLRLAKVEAEVAASPLAISESRLHREKVAKFLKSVRLA